MPPAQAPPTRTDAEHDDRTADEALGKPARVAAAVTVAGLVGAGAAFWAVQHYEVVDKAKDAVL